MRLIDADMLSPDRDYYDNSICSGYDAVSCQQIDSAKTVEAIPIPRGATNGDVIKTMFPDAEIREIMGSFDKAKLLGYRVWLGGRSQDYLLDWWNAPFKR